MRIVVLVAALGGLMSAAVDPDELLKALRRISYRSALTASLATRLVPVLARDAGAHGRRRALPPAAARPPRGRRAPRWRARSTARWTWPPRSRCAATRWPGARRAAAAPVSRHDLRIGAAALAIAALAIAGAAAGVGHVEAYPTLDVALGPGRARRWRARWCCSAARRCSAARARLGVARA